jgi:hypothetical protein
VGSARSSGTSKKPSAALVRLTAEAAKASQRADEAKQRVKLAKAELKKARKLAKTAKKTARKVAKQARKKAAALASASDAGKPEVRTGRPQASLAIKPGRPRRGSRAPIVARKSSAAAVARSVIERMTAASKVPAAPVDQMGVSPPPPAG